MAVTVHTKKFLLLAAVLISLYPGCGAQLPACPQSYGTGILNTAQFLGAPTSFARTDNSGQKVQWQVIPTDQENSDPNLFDITNYDDKVDSTLNSSYTVNATHLTVLSSTVGPQGMMPYATGGAYILTYQSSGCVTEAGLIVVFARPTCGCNASNPSSKMLTCNIQYTCFNRQYITPIMTWTGINGTAPPDNNPAPQSTNDSFPDQNNYTSQYPVASTDGSTYTCQVTFGQPIPDSSSSIATNAPAFTASCSAYCPVPFLQSNCFNQNLTHTVVYVGNSTAFLRPTNGYSVQWGIYPSSVTFSKFRIITNYGDILTSEFTKTYQANGSQLTIPIATVGPQSGYSNYSTAGLYTMTYQNTNCTIAANLIVIQSGPTCATITYTASNVTLMCSVYYAQVTVQECNPVFTWRNSNGLIVKTDTPQPYQNQTNVKVAQSQFPITSSDTATYQCQLTYSAPPQYQLAYVASKAPTFNASCSAKR